MQTVADDPEAAALAYFDAAPRRQERRRARLRSSPRRAATTIADVRRRLAEVERLYLDRLMHTRDANEGLAAFLAKRKPEWEHR